jgi:AcrR family transcriptional regulator
MTLRERQATAVKDAIVDAALDLFVERRDLDMSIQQIADRAGVSHRTVYRYFDDKQALIEAASVRFGARLRGPAPSTADTLEEHIGNTRERFAFYERNLDLFRAAMRAGADSSLGPAPHDTAWELFLARFPDLDDATQRRRFAIVRHLLSAATFITLKDRFDLGVNEAADAIEWALSQLIADIDAERTSQ